MSYTSEHKRLEPVLKLARRLDIAVNPEPEAIFDPALAGFLIHCTPDNHPEGWNTAKMSAGTYSKPCSFVASVYWGWTDEEITFLRLRTDATDTLDPMSDENPYNRKGDVAWAKAKIRKLFAEAGVPCPRISVEKGW